MSSIMVLGLGLVLVLDFHSERAQRLSEKSVALHDEAAMLLPMVRQLRHQGLEGVQQFIDDACAAMQETTSPGHHIAVELGPVVIQARSHHRATPEMLQALRDGARSSSHRAHLGAEPLLVATARRDDASVYVSEYVENVLRTSRRETLWRSGWIALVGILATAIMDWALVRLIANPVGCLVSTVRKIGQGQLGAKVAVLNSVELQFLASELNQMSTALSEEKAHRSRQMEKARRIQERLRPAAGDIGGWSVACLYRPAEEVGGDYFDYRLIRDGILVACVADVTGHGVPAAMGAAMLKTLFSAAVMRSEDPAEILHLVNDGFRAVSLEEDFASMIVVTLDRATLRLRFASAGHEPAYLLRRNADPFLLESTGILVGIDADAVYETGELILQPGDRLVMPTDGWAEATLANGQMFGRDSLIAVLRSGLAHAPEEMIATAIDCLESSVAEPPGDDLTLLVIEWPIKRM